MVMADADVEQGRRTTMPVSNDREMNEANLAFLGYADQHINMKPSVVNHGHITAQSERSVSIILPSHLRKRPSGISFEISNEDSMVSESDDGPDDDVSEYILSDADTSSVGGEPSSTNRTQSSTTSSSTLKTGKSAHSTSKKRRYGFNNKSAVAPPCVNCSTYETSMWLLSADPQKPVCYDCGTTGKVKLSRLLSNGHTGVCSSCGSKDKKGQCWRWSPIDSKLSICGSCFYYEYRKGVRRPVFTPSGIEIARTLDQNDGKGMDTFNEPDISVADEVSIKKGVRRPVYTPTGVQIDRTLDRYDEMQKELKKVVLSNEPGHVLGEAVANSSQKRPAEIPLDEISSSAKLLKVSTSLPNGASSSGTMGQQETVGLLTLNLLPTSPTLTQCSNCTSPMNTAGQREMSAPATPNLASNNFNTTTTVDKQELRKLKYLWDHAKLPSDCG
ncbi:hypothetical protein HDU76_008807, partial [Blyttiomyces sp. JEL0837]